MNAKRTPRRIASRIAICCVVGVAGVAAEAPHGIPRDRLAPTAQVAIDRGIQYLLGGQQDDGGWEAFGKSHLGVTALVVKCIVQHRDHGPDHPATRRGLAFLVRHTQPDGGIYVPGEGLRNYYSSVALMALSAANRAVDTTTINRLQSYLRELQWDGGEGHERSSSWYGGQGYGRHKRPDLSNTQMMLEALHQSGLPHDDPAYRKALTFISRCQLLDETNDQPLADGSVDGGFIYTPAGGGESKAGVDRIGDRLRLRSYGSMTYAGFKSLLYADVGRDDVRVKRAMDWIRGHYTLQSNPNMPGEKSREGLYYYYHVFARAMAAWGEDVIVDTYGVPHDWRAELVSKLVELQRPNGSWVNERDRWYEGNPHLVTAYAVLALQTAQIRGPRS